MLSKIHNSAVALILLLGLVGTPKIATSSELKNIFRTNIAQASTEEITPQTDDERGGTSWYWLLLLLIPLGLGGMLLARRTQTGAEVKGRDNLYSTTNANTPTTTTDRQISSLDSSQIVNGKDTANGTATINKIEDETILTTGLTAYDIVGERQVEGRGEILAKENESDSTASSDRQSEESIEKTEIASVSEGSGQTSENSDREMRDLFSELEISADSKEEISIEEITFEESSKDLDYSSDEDGRIFDWLESLDDSQKDDNLDEISQWLNSLDRSESTNDSHFSATTIDSKDTHDSLSEIDEGLSTSDDDTFQELQDLLDEDLKRHRER